MDKWTVYKKTDDFRVAAPKSVLDVVEIKSIDENGIFEVGRGGVFTKTYFATLENSMMQSFREIGSRLNPLDATERLRILHDFYRFGNEEYFEFDFRRAIEQGFDFKDAIINTTVSTHGFSTRILFNLWGYVIRWRLVLE